MILGLVALFICIFLLVVVSEFLVGKIGILVKILRLPSFVISSIFLAIATSLPELSIGLISTANKQSALSLGNILGANIVNLTLILGLVCLLTGNVSTKNKTLSQDILVTAIAGILPLFFLWDYKITSTEGVILIAVYIIYNILLVSKRKLPRFQNYKNNRKKTSILFLEFITGLIVIAVCASFVVKISEELALALESTTCLFGTLFLSIGTSLPEFVVSLKAGEKKEAGVLLGNVFGSVIVNSTFILGLMAFFSPIYLPDGKFRMIMTVYLLFCFVLLPIFFKTRKKLERKEGLVLVLFYISFVLAFLFIK